MDRGAWRAAVHGVAKSWTRLNLHALTQLFAKSRKQGSGRWGGGGRGGSGWEAHVHPWLIHLSEWQKPLQYFKVISVQLK